MNSLRMMAAALVAACVLYAGVSANGKMTAGANPQPQIKAKIAKPSAAVREIPISPALEKKLRQLFCPSCPPPTCPGSPMCPNTKK